METRPFIFKCGSRNNSHGTVALERSYGFGLFPLNTQSFGPEYKERGLC